MERDPRVQTALDRETEGTRNVRKIPSHHPASFIFVFAPPLSTQDQAPRRDAESIS